MKRHNVIGIAVMLVCGFILFFLPPVISSSTFYEKIPFTLTLNNASGQIQIYWRGNGEDWSENNAQNKQINHIGQKKITYYVPVSADEIRIDFDVTEQVTLEEAYFSAAGAQLDCIQDIQNGETMNIYIKLKENTLHISPYGEDSHIILNMVRLNKLQEPISRLSMMLDGFTKILISIILGFIVWKSEACIELGRQVWKGRKLILNLAQNDLKGRFVGSALGIVWAFIPPVVTIAVYCFVFQFGLRAGDTADGVPYVLWLVSGMVPWLFFSEAWISTASSLMEYHYLVKKMVFQTSLLPIVKIISSAFIHVIFLALSVVLFFAFGHFPTLYWLQVIYYFFCLILLIVGLGWLSASLTPFLRDVNQVIGISTQIGFWITPIAWRLDQTVHSPWLKLLFSLNPMTYIIQGYRDSFLGGQWFWQKGYSIYYWMIVASLFVISAMIFRKMRVHFADVL